MLDVFKVVGSFFRRTRANTDSVLFRFHYHVTVAILLLFCLIVGINQYLRSPIVCSSDSVSRDVLDVYCWTDSTFTTISSLKRNSNRIGSVAQPGVGSKVPEEEVKTQTYYQWVFWCLFIQAVLFYIPRWLWKNWEGGKLQTLRMDLDIAFTSETEKLNKKNLLLDYLQHNRGNNNWWTYRYFFCEFLALINVFGQMFLMDRFLDGAFWSYGPKVVNFVKNDDEDQIDPLIYVFPRLTKCIFYKFGPSGVPQKHDAICFLPLNIFNEKIYVFLWFWFLILFITTILWVIFRITLIFIRQIRYYVMIIRFPRLRRDIVYKFANDTDIGDWYLLYMLGENLDTIIFRDVLHELPEKYGSLRDTKYELTEAL